MSPTQKEFLAELESLSVGEVKERIATNTLIGCVRLKMLRCMPVPRLRFSVAHEDLVVTPRCIFSIAFLYRSVEVISEWSSALVRIASAM